MKGKKVEDFDFFDFFAIFVLGFCCCCSFVNSDSQKKVVVLCPGTIYDIEQENDIDPETHLRHRTTQLSYHGDWRENNFKNNMSVCFKTAYPS